MDRQPIRRALVSVFDKTGIEQLATMLDKAGVDVVSTGSTAKALTDAGLKVTEVSTVTGFPECLDGRVKTLHPRIHAGILADRRLHSHRDQLAELGVEPFDLVVCNLYPFSQTVASGAGFDDCIEKIDIGPKGAVLTHRNLLMHAFSQITTLGWDPEDRVNVPGAPMFHIAGLAGGVLAAYVGMLGGTDPVEQAFYAKHLLAASIMAAPATLVVAKLLLVDMAGVGTLYRIVSFIGVGLLMLVIGYVSPLPPAAPAAGIPAREEEPA